MDPTQQQHQHQHQRPRPSWLIMIVSASFLLAPAWSIFNLLQLIGTPRLIAAVAAAGVDVLMLMSGWTALQRADDGDATWPWHLGMLALALVSISAQIVHPLLTGQPLISGVVLATLAVGGVAMIEGQLRRVHRLKARLDQRLPMARPRPSAEQWLFFRREARIATRLAVANPASTATDVFSRAVEITAELDRPKPPPVRGQLAAGALPPGMSALESGLSPDTSGHNPDLSGPESGPRPDIGPGSGPVSVLVRAMIGSGIADDAQILSAVVRINPDANPDTIRRTISRERLKQQTA